MPPVSQYVLKGGPCDGKKGQLTGAIATAGQLTCQNHIYKVELPVQLVSGREVFLDAGPVPKPPPPSTAAHTHHGWQDVRHSVNHNMPAALRAAKQSTDAALRSLGRGRKVRG